MIIAVRPQPLGHLELEPVGYQAKEIVRQSNKYDGTCTVYLQGEQEIEDFLNSLPTDIVQDIQNRCRIDIDIDEHTYRHMLGGQSD
jgi:hypothetical protein